MEEILSRDRIELRDGRWQLRAGSTGDEVQGVDAAETGGERPGRGNVWIFGAGLFAIVVAAFLLRKRRRGRR